MGQNAWGSSGAITTDYQAVVDSWYKEKKDYNYAGNSCSAAPGDACGHYTQVTAPVKSSC